jgi:hypothetical protein
MFSVKAFFSCPRLIRVALMGVTIFLVGCSPEYNWRELSVANGRAMVAFPAKVQTESRPLKIDQYTLQFSLTSAAVKQNLFAVGYAPLPPELSQAQQTAIKNALLKSLAANLGVTLPSSAHDSEPFVLESLSTRPIRLVARVLIHRGYYIQFVSTGPSGELNSTITEEFMRSISLR